MFLRGTGLGWTFLDEMAVSEGLALFRIESRHRCGLVAMLAQNACFPVDKSTLAEFPCLSPYVRSRIEWLCFVKEVNRPRIERCSRCGLATVLAWNVSFTAIKKAPAEFPSRSRMGARRIKWRRF